MPRHFLWLAAPFSLAGIAATIILHTPPLSHTWLHMAEAILGICGFWVFIILCWWLREEVYWCSFQSFMDESIEELRKILRSYNKESIKMWNDVFFKTIENALGVTISESYKSNYDKNNMLIWAIPMEGQPLPSEWYYFILFLRKIKENKTELAPKLKIKLGENNYKS
jgi:hypothetical protein